jgi:hypothetical protein
MYDQAAFIRLFYLLHLKQLKQTSQGWHTEASLRDLNQVQVSFGPMIRHVYNTSVRQHLHQQHSQVPEVKKCHDK